MLYSTDYPFTFDTRPRGYPFLEQASFTDDEKARSLRELGKLTGHLAVNTENP